MFLCICELFHRWVNTLSYDFLDFKCQNHRVALFVRDLHQQALHPPRTVWLPVLETISPVTLDQTLEKELWEKKPGEALLGVLLVLEVHLWEVHLRSGLAHGPCLNNTVALPDLIGVLSDPGLAVRLPYGHIPGWQSSNVWLTLVTITRLVLLFFFSGGALALCSLCLTFSTSSLFTFPYGVPPSHGSPTSIRWISDKVLPLFWNCSWFMMNVNTSYLYYLIKVVKNFPCHLFPWSQGGQEAFYKNNYRNPSL